MTRSFITRAFLVLASLAAFGGRAAAVPILPLQFSPAALQFGVATLGETTASVQVSFHLRDGAAPFGPMRLQLSDPAHFQMTADTCTGLTLMSGSSCEVDVVFHPDLFGHYSSFLVALDGSGALGNFVPLEGIGAESGFSGAPGPLGESTTASLSTEQLNFSTQSPGTTGAAQSVTLINTGSNDLRIAATTFGGDEPFHFARIDACMPKLVAPGGTCVITAFFTPVSAEPAQAALAIAANVPDTPLVIALGGNGGVEPTTSSGGCALSPSHRAVHGLFAAAAFYSLLVLFRRRRLQ